jgi:DNA-binding LacI/PurR family transcriptional regulator
MSKPTMDDVARDAGVSRALVSLVMRDSDKVSDRSRHAVLASADRLGYRPNLNARHLASKRTGTVGVVINDLHNPYFPGVTDGIKRAADQHGLRLMLNSSFLFDSGELSAMDTFVDFQVDGIILIGARADVEAIERAATTMPTVIISRPMDSRVLDTVGNDDRLGATMATQHLIDLGHRHICHIEGGPSADAVERRNGYEITMRAHGLEPWTEAAHFTEESGVAAARRIFDSGRPCTAIFAGNDLSALGALDVIDSVGLSVPGDISLVGYDNTFIAALQHIGLTSIDQHGDRLGEIAIELLSERIEGRSEARHLTIAPTIVERDTSGAPPSRAGA